MRSRVCLGIGIILVTIGLALFVYVFLFQLRAEVAEGKVVEVIKQASGNVAKPWIFTPVVAYTTKDMERTYLDTSAVFSHTPEYLIGTRIKVFYDKIHPERAIIGGRNSYLGSIVAGSIGVIFMVFALIDHLMRGKGRKQGRIFSIGIGFQSDI